ncbi:MAG: ComF family protein [Vicinamibacteraceae bacterium]
MTLLFAPPCATCDAPLDQPSASSVCQACWQAIGRWSPPWCVRCGQPHAAWRADADICPRCRRIPAALPVRAVGPYEGRLRDVLHAFKYDGRRSLAPPLAALVRAQSADLLAAADVLVPVPLHRARRRSRGFNQAHDLAAALGPPVVAALRRIRATTAQTELTAGGRRRNVRGAFAIAPAGYRRGSWSAESRRRAMTEAIAGRVVVLVDDVITTGATLEACAAVLRAAGAADVRAVTVARAVIGRRR